MSCKMSLFSNTSRGLYFALCISFLSFPAYAESVTPDNMRGWVVSNQGSFTAPFEFKEGPGTPTAGDASLNIGPIGTVPANKFILFPPIQNIDAADLVSLSFDFYLNSIPMKSPSQFYVNVYVDLPQNGLGIFGSGSFYDCRFDLVANGALPLDTWNTVQFSQSSAWTQITDQTSPSNLCPATLNGLTANSKVLFIAINVGDTSLSDEGLIGAVDNAVININGQITKYDFEEDDETCFVSNAANENVVVFCL